MTGPSANEGEFETSTTIEAPARVVARPSPVTALKPELGEAATTSWPRARRLATTLPPMRPVPPTTTIFSFDEEEFGFIPIRRNSPAFCDRAGKTRSSEEATTPKPVSHERTQ